jgi:hypothetical protein
MSNKMIDYKIVVVMWNDHVHIDRSPLPEDLEDLQLRPTLSIGAIIKETEEVLILASDIDRYEDGDDLSYTVIYKNAIVGQKEYGTIPIENLRFTK